MIQLSELKFTASAHEVSEFPPDSGREVALAGRSNAGKSTALNALANHHRLAFVSKTPGRTQTINFFSCGRDCRLVDLPGYGFAAVSRDEKRHWGQLISHYLMSRASLSGLVLIMDARHPLTPLDRQLLDWFQPAHKPVHILLAKSDKLARYQAQAVLHSTAAALRGSLPAASVQLFSGIKGTGLPEARKVITGWLQ